MKYLAIDLGEKRIGLATSDTNGVISQPFLSFQRKSDTEAIDRISQICTKENIDRIVLGIPYSASESNQKRFYSFKEKLEKSLETTVETWDETFSTKQAQNMVAFSDAVPERRRTNKHRDDVAAAIILQEYLDNEKRT